MALLLLLLLLPLASTQSPCNGPCWEENWITLIEENCTGCTVTVKDTEATLSIPESPYFGNVESVIAQLKIVPVLGEFSFVIIREDTSSPELLNETLSDGNGLKVKDYLNYDDGGYNETVTYNLMVNVEIWRECTFDGAIDVELWNCRRLSVKLLNVNDERPKFTSEYGTTIFTIPSFEENHDYPNAHNITIEGQDQEIDELPLSLKLSNDYDGKFSITNTADKTNSWGINAQNLDYDKGQKTYSLDLSLCRTDSSNFVNETCTDTTLIASITDMPDQSPQWEMACNYVGLEEMLPADTTFFSIKAIDIDVGVNSEIAYKIIDSSDSEYFDMFLNESSGYMDIKNKEPIDRETLDGTSGIMKFDIMATEPECIDCDPSINSTCMVRILDMDDNLPTFGDKITGSTVTEYHAWVREDISKGSRFEFRDNDNQTIQPYAYDLDQYDESYNVFDLEIISSHPDIAESFAITPNTITGNGVFNVNSKITPNTYLDFEEHESVTFMIATNKNVDVNVTIHVIDINDCDPVFTEETYTITIKEDFSDGFLLSVDSTDDDKSENFGRLSHFYKISDIDNTEKGLSIDNSSGELRVLGQPFDFEFQEEYTYEVTVTDCKGDSPCSPQKMDKATVVITVTNINDVAPEITNPKACVIPFRNTRYVAGEEVVLFDGSDEDGSTWHTTFLNPDQTISEHFKLEDGTLSLIKELGEIEGTYSFSVIIEDDGNTNSDPTVDTDNKLSTTYPCEFTIEDENDHSPEFKMPSDRDRRYWIDINSAIDENLKLLTEGGIDLQINAIDDDVNTANSDVKYSFDNMQNEFFQLDEEKGTILLLKNLSTYKFELDNLDGTSNLIILQLTAQDQGTDCTLPNTPPRGCSSTTTLNLKATVNFPPEFDPAEQTITRAIHETVDSDLSVSISLPKAIDKNNDPEQYPPEVHPDDDAIFYLMKRDEEVQQFFSLNMETNVLSVTSPIDYDCAGCRKSFNIIIAASNTNNFDFVSAEGLSNSIQNVTVNIRDVNDNVPRFDNLPDYFVLESTGCRDCNINAQDDDTALDTILKFEILNVTTSHSSLPTSNPFTYTTLDDDSIQLESNFPLSGAMTGFFDLEIQVTDNKPQSNSTHVKVVVMTDQNNVTFGFDNTQEEVCSHKKDIERIFLQILDWKFTEKDQLSCNRTRSFEAEPYSSGEITEFQGYFVSSAYEPMTQMQIAAKYDRNFKDLWLTLHNELNISLDADRGYTRNPEQFGFLVVGIISGGLIAITALFLLGAYCVRTKALERRVKALDTDAVEDTGASEGQQRKHTDKAAMESNDFEEDFKFEDDNMSQSSGDSIFIGVEDQTEFADYAEKMKEIDVDMDLYSRLQGNRYKTLDDYQGPGTEDHAGKNPLYDDNEDEA